MMANTPRKSISHTFKFFCVTVSTCLPFSYMYIYFTYGKMIAVFKGYQQNPLKCYGRKLNTANSRRIIEFYKFN